MPGSWPDDDAAGEGDEESPFAPPVHPDDRLWRHPSELAWAPLHRRRAAAGGPPAGPAVPGGGGRTVGVALASGLVGAAVALGAVALAGGLGATGVERIVERVGVRDQLGDPLAARSPAGVPNVVAAVSPSVVRLEAEVDGERRAGSGIVLLDDGHVVTNLHVVAGATAVTIVLADGTAVSGEVVGADPVTDLAVVAPADEANTATWTPAVWGSAADLRVGEPLLALVAGRDGGEPTALLGMVSALRRRVWVDDRLTLHGMIQTDLPVEAAASGGALCDRTGRVVGVMTAAGGDAEVGYATSMDAAWHTAEALIKDGEVHHVWLGIEGADLDATGSSVLGVDAPGGVVVERVMPESPAEVAGIQAGDVLTAVDGERIGTMSDLVLVLRGHVPGEAPTFSVLRDGTVVDLPVALIERPG